jgi:hypothetical protein
VSVLLWGALVAPATANHWRPDDVVPGSVVWAKVVGEECPGVLSASEIAELDAYLAKAAAEWEGDPKSPGFSFKKFATDLAGTYAGSYPKECAGDAAEARDILQRARKAMATGKPLLGSKD